MLVQGIISPKDDLCSCAALDAAGCIKEKAAQHAGIKLLAAVQHTSVQSCSTFPSRLNQRPCSAASALSSGLAKLCDASWARL